MKENTAIDFSGQILYVGNDVHKRNWRMAIRCNRRFLKVVSMDPRSNVLHDYLHKHYPGAEYHVVYEAGFSGFWAQRELESLGIKTIVVNPGDVPTNNKERERKSDVVDCRKLARCLENGELTGIYIPTVGQEHLRAIGRIRVQIVKREVQVKNRIKSFAMVNNQSLPGPKEMGHWSARFVQYLSTLDYEDESGNYVRDMLLKQLRDVRSDKAGVMTELRRVYRTTSAGQETMTLLRSVPGIGEITALSLCLEVVDIDRFSNGDKLASSIGVIPSIRSSDEHESVYGMTNRHNRFLRYMIIEATWIAIGIDPALTSRYNKLCQRMPKNRAIVHMAKILVRRIYRVWRDREPYRLSI